MVIEALRALLGPDRVATDLPSLDQHAADTWPLRLVQRAVGAELPRPLCVVRPQSTAEVAGALACLRAHGVPVVPFGGGSGVAGGAQPSAGAVVIDVGALDHILRLNEEELTVTAQAGVFLGHLEEWLGKHGYTTGHYPQSIALAQLGGLVATRSAGQFSTKYGNIEDLLVGLEAVLPDGQTIKIGPVPRWAAGPDLRALWLGSEGAFGIITEVTLKIVPKPAARWLQAYAAPTVKDGLMVVQGIMREGWRPAVVRLHDATEAERSYPGAVGEGESILLVLSEGPQGYVDAEHQAVETIAAAGGLRPLGAGPVEQWLEHRNDVRLFYQLTEMGVLVDTIEVVAGWTAIADIYERVTAQLKAEVPELLAVSGHSSHSYAQGTNLYFIVVAQPPRDPAEVERVYQSIWQRVMETTLACGGSINHHHGIGKLRAPWLPRQLGAAYGLLTTLKQAFDPAGLMNPGTLLPWSPGAEEAEQ
ncbi:MAG TPA: FAD-binding oxidoreductase [Symbiobacteriaceae bacterium]|nr:FAD-binding oxidoreductase [Symbiobacteriaceae bacterium]